MQNDNENENADDRDQHRIDAAVEELRVNTQDPGCTPFSPRLEPAPNNLDPCSSQINALKRNRSVARLSVDPAICPIPAFSLLLDCSISSNQRFNHITINDIKDALAVKRPGKSTKTWLVVFSVQ
jgi:hypothetical protein